MPITWNEASPADTDGAGTAASALRSLKANLATGLATSVYWPGSGGASAASAGWPKIGTARPLYGTQSQVSAYADAFLMLTSDTSRLFAVNSASTVFLGGSRVIESSSTSMAANTHYVFATGEIQNSVVGGYGVTFTQSPVLIVQPESGTLAAPMLRGQPSTSTFLVDAYIMGSGGTFSASTLTFVYLAYGPVSF